MSKQKNMFRLRDRQARLSKGSRGRGRGRGGEPFWFVWLWANQRTFSLKLRQVTVCVPTPLHYKSSRRIPLTDVLYDTQFELHRFSRKRLIYQELLQDIKRICHKCLQCSIKTFIIMVNSRSGKIISRFSQRINFITIGTLSAAATG